MVLGIDLELGNIVFSKGSRKEVEISLHPRLHLLSTEAEVRNLVFNPHPHTLLSWWHPISPDRNKGPENVETLLQQHCFPECFLFVSTRALTRAHARFAG